MNSAITINIPVPKFLHNMLTPAPAPVFAFEIGDTVRVERDSSSSTYVGIVTRKRYIAHPEHPYNAYTVAVCIDAKRNLWKLSTYCESRLTFSMTEADAKSLYEEGKLWQQLEWGYRYFVFGQAV